MVTEVEEVPDKWKNANAMPIFRESQKDCPDVCKLIKSNFGSWESHGARSMNEEKHYSPGK